MIKNKKIALFFALSLALVILRLVFIGTTMVIDDEAYYAIYARHLSPGYIDHGPTVAFIIWLFTLVFGETGFGVRIGSVFLLSLMGWILYQFGKKHFSERAGIVLSALVISNLLFHTNGVIITPDAPLAFFTICAMMLYFRGYHEDPKFMIPGGVLLGIALLSKISAAFPALALALYPFLNRNKRSLLKDSRYYISFLTAFAVFSPFLIWNARNGWAFFVYQGSHVTEGGGVDSFIELWAGLFILIGPVLFYYAALKPTFLCLTKWKKKSSTDALRFFALMTVIPFLYFLIHSFFSRMEINWPSPVFFGGLFVCAIIFDEQWDKLKNFFTAQILYSLTLVGIITVQTYIPFLPVSGKSDITNRYFYYSSFKNEVKSYIEDELNGKGLRIASNNFQIPSMLNLYAMPKIEAVCLSIDYHETLYSFLYPDSSLAGEDLIIIWEGSQFPKSLKPYFVKIKKLKTFESKRRGSVLEQYTFWECSAYKGKILIKK